METFWIEGGGSQVRYPRAQNMAKVLEFISSKTPFELIIFASIWLFSLIIIIYGAYQWTHEQSKLKKIEAELETLSK